MPQQLQAILFDWAGTTVDYGSRAPAQVFQEIFRRSGVEITVSEAREPMGRAKRDHIATILAMPRVAAAWLAAHGNPGTDADIDRMYQAFLPLQKATLQAGSAVIPGVPEVVAECRRRGLRIGSTTGYTRELMEVVRPVAKAGGYEPDVVFCADEVAAGRPAPWLNFRACEALGVYPLSKVVIVDDTPIGIAAGLNSGCWTVAVARTGNALGLSEEEIAALPPDNLRQRLQSIADQFRQAGAHYVIDGVSDLLPVLAKIEDRLNRGERP